MKNHHDPHNNPKRALNANYFFLAVDVLRSGRFASKRIFQLISWVKWVGIQILLLWHQEMCCVAELCKEQIRAICLFTTLVCWKTTFRYFRCDHTLFHVSFFSKEKAIDVYHAKRIFYFFYHTQKMFQRLQKMVSTSMIKWFFTTFTEVLSASNLIKNLG